ncbi:hypothetical protein HAZT_HAZT011554 [Hyalella azteca]|uniref:Uncharacterized protein LOC108667130 n=1 Tax=Hyalella azteca TaxID=294128 RepID=A0A6A0GSU0_HYAAZ|nr:uncharacterized protein LOC108667130 [Hyalella azteca]KAA0186830.1 hypothetical protein HAZT_HAZT011554 [Hyalella azteca]
MSVIIRLQNLPWSANASDIREFFKGLLIPEGGVHIVGGEQGDAFIAFGSDEDARLAMRKSNGILKGIQVVLLLSSRAEMQKVIETARQQAMAQQQSFGATVASTSVQQLPQAVQQPVAAPPVAYTNPDLMKQQPQVPQYGGMGQYYSGSMYDKPSPAVAPQTPESVSTTLSAPFGFASSPEQAAQRWRNGFGKTGPAVVGGQEGAMYNRQMMVQSSQFAVPFGFNANNATESPNPYAATAQKVPVSVVEEYDEKELYQQALKASKKSESQAPEKVAYTSTITPFTAPTVTAAADKSRPNSSTHSGSKTSSSNNQSPRRSESSSEKKDVSRDKDKSKDKDKYGRDISDERDRDSRRRRSKSRSRSRSRERRRRHRSRSRSRDRSTRRRRSRSKERQDRGRDRDKSRVSSSGRDRSERRTSDDKPSNEASAPAALLVPSKNSGATLPGLGEIPQELPRSLPNAILGKPPSQEIITSDMHVPSMSLKEGASPMEQAWGMDLKMIKNTQGTQLQQQPPQSLGPMQSQHRDPRMHAPRSVSPVAPLHNVPRTDRWGIPIPEPMPESHPRKTSDLSAPAESFPLPGRLPMDSNFRDDMRGPLRQPENWDKPEMSSKERFPVAHPYMRNDIPPERPQLGCIEDSRDPRARPQNRSRSPDVINRGPIARREGPDGPGPSRWGSPPRNGPNNFMREQRGPRMDEPGYLEPSARGMDMQRMNDNMDRPSGSMERFSDEPNIPGRFPRDDRRWDEPGMPERYIPGPEGFPPREEPCLEGPADPFEGAGRGMRGRGGFEGRGMMRGRRRGFGRFDGGDGFFPECDGPERFRPSFPGENRFDDGPRRSPSGPGAFRGRGAPRGYDMRGGYTRGTSPVGGRPQTCSVELLNLPLFAGYRMIRDSFYGIFVPHDSIKLLGDENGMKIGVALVRFNTVADAMEAARRDGMFICEQKIQIRLIDEEIYDKHEDFKSVLRQHRPPFEPIPAGNFMPSEWVHIMGMPPNKTVDDVANIFSNSYINDILREVYPNTKKATGGFFMRLSCPDEAHVLVNESQGMEIEGNVIHLRQAMFPEVEESTIKLAERHLIEDSNGPNPHIENMDRRRDMSGRHNADMTKPMNNTQSIPGRKGALLATPAAHPQKVPQGSGEGKRPQENKNEEEPPRKRIPIDEDLLTDSVVVHDVQMGTTHCNVVDFFSDEGLVPEHVHFVPYDPKFGGRVFVIFPKIQHAKQALRKSGKLLGPAPVRIELIAKPEVMNAMGLPFNPLELIKKSDPDNDCRPDNAMPPRSNRLPLLDTPTNGPSGQPSEARESPDLSSSSMSPPAPKQGEVIPEQFGSPGCVVALSNLPLNASTEDILHFLAREFPRVSPDNVIRRYNEHNQPTSDARVAFNTPEDAEKAVHLLNRKPIFNRPIYLNLVET